MSRKSGYIGETVAREFLEAKGYTCIAQNFYSRFGEIDLIMQSLEQGIVFVEVKAYKRGSLVHPLEKIGKKKQDRLVQTARLFLCRYDHSIESRFDAVLVDDTHACVHIEHIISHR